MIDHLVYATPDLAATVDDLRRRGVSLLPGGQHVGLGTRNHLVRLGDDGAYLEVIGPDVEQPEPQRARPFGIDGLTAPRLVTWAVRVPDLGQALARCRAAGYDPGPATPMSRRRQDGVVLHWHLTAMSEDGIVPFLIDWGDTPHPSESLPTGVRLASLRGTHPDPATVMPRLAALAQPLPVATADTPALEAVLETPQATVVLR